MRAGRCVGRVGGLAVALGVGAAVSLGVGAAAAWAEDGPGGNTADSSASASPNSAKPAKLHSSSKKLTGHGSPSRATAPARHASVAAVSVAPSKPVTHRSAGKPSRDAGGPLDAPATLLAGVATRRQVAGVTDTDEVSAVAAATSTASRVSVAGSVYVGGEPLEMQPTLSPDGSRAVLTVGVTDQDAYIVRTRVAVVDTATGRQVGRTEELASEIRSAPVFNGDGTRVVIVTRDEAAVIDPRTGARVGTTFSLDYPTTPVMSPDGTRAVIVGESGTVVINTVTGTRVGTTLPANPGWTTAAWIGNSPNAVITSFYGHETGFETHVAVLDTTTGSQVGSALILDGRWTPTRFSADGTRALITSEDAEAAGGTLTRLAVIDTTTGGQIGSGTAIPGSTITVSTAAHPDRVLVTTRTADPVTNADSVLVSMIDVTTGAQIGNPVAILGTSYQAVVSAGPDRLLVMSYTADNYTILNATMTLIDTTTGAQVGSGITLASRSDTAPLLSADGTRALFTNNFGTAVIVNTATGTQTGATLALTGRPQAFQPAGVHALISTDVGDGINESTRVTLFDIGTGAQVGTPLTVRGTIGTAMLSPDGTRAMIVTSIYNWFTGTRSTRVTVVNTSTGKQVGFTLSLSGEVWGADQLSPNGSRILLTRRIWNPFTMSGTTRLTVVDTNTGRLVSTRTLNGDLSGPPERTADGSRAVLSTSTYNYFTRKATARLAVLRIY